MQVRLDTVSLTDEDRRAIRFATQKKRTKATRDEARTWLDSVLNAALEDLRYRWNGRDAAEVVGAPAAPAIPVENDAAPEGTSDATPAE